MIDYEKLKIAHELTAKIQLSTISMKYSDHDGAEYYFHSPNTDSFLYSNLDDLIAKLQELTQPQPKYKVGEKVWHQIDGVIFHVEIHSIQLQDEKSYIYRLSLDGCYIVEESAIFSTKEALIDAQIKHWTEMREPIFGTEIPISKGGGPYCQHESDGIDHFLHSKDDILKAPVETFSKCTKCGKFYK